MSVGTLYVSNSAKLSSTGFHTIPFIGAKLDYHNDSADNFSFKSNKKLEHGTRVRYNDPRGKRYSFGGQVYKSKESTNGLYEYNCVSYLRLYLSKIPAVSYSNITASNLLKKLIKKDPNNFSTAGLTKTTNKHAYLKWEKKSIWEIARQLQYLEWKANNPVECYVDIDGILHFGKSIKTQTGYTFTTNGEGTNTILGYEEDHATENVVTVGTVTYKGDTRASAKASRDMVATWGYVEGDSFDCTENVSKNKSSSDNSSSTNSDGQAFINKYNINSKIVKQANSIIGNSTTDKAKAKKIFNWMRENIKYPHPRYACTKKGALGTLNSRVGNCADQTHLYMALAGSVGLQVRCNHISGHFFPETKINGKWFITDTVTSKGWGHHACSGSHLAYYSNPNTFNC